MTMITFIVRNITSPSSKSNRIISVTTTTFFTEQLLVRYVRVMMAMKVQKCWRSLWPARRNLVQSHVATVGCFK